MNRLSDREMLEIAKARQAVADDMDAKAAAEGNAIRLVRGVFGVVGRSPGKKRSATSGCSRDNRKFHGRLSLLPVATEAAQVIREPAVIMGARRKDGKPFARSIIVRGLHAKKLKKK